MTLDEIRKKKPEGATHYRIGINVSLIYYKYISDDEVYFYRPKHKIWSVTGNSLENEEIKPLY